MTAEKIHKFTSDTRDVIVLVDKTISIIYLGRYHKELDPVAVRFDSFKEYAIFLRKAGLFPTEIDVEI